MGRYTLPAGQIGVWVAGLVLAALLVLTPPTEATQPWWVQEVMPQDRPLIMPQDRPAMPSWDCPALSGSPSTWASWGLGGVWSEVSQ